MNRDQMTPSLVQITPAQKPVKVESATGQKYWRSLDQLSNTAEFQNWVEREFPSSAADLMDGNSRRTVLKLMAASFGLAGLTACSRPEFRLAPSARGREDYIPGSPYHYTSVFSINGQAAGIVVETYDGRPVKIEGNPDHPASLGAATALAQASLLNLYDPDRVAHVTEGGKESDWEKFVAAVKGLNLGDGSGLRFVSETVNSPSLENLRADVLKKYPKAKWVEYESVDRSAERAGAQAAFGQALIALPQFDKAKVVLSLDADFLGSDSQTPLPTKQFSKRRRTDSEEDLANVSRLYVVESQFSLTGANAEHRLRMKGGEVKQFALDLLAALGGTAAQGNEKRAKFLNAVAKDLKAAGAQALVVAGPRQSAGVHALVHAINQALGANGSTVMFAKASSADRVEYGVAALKSLTGELSGGQVQTLVVLGGNPAYTAPVDVNFAAAIAKAANSIYLATEADETAAAAKWVLPQAHYLEAWGDVRNDDGTVAIQQPVIEPLYGGKSALEVLALLAGSAEAKGLDIVKNYWLGQLQGSKENAWRKALNDGVISGTKAADIKASADAGKARAAAEAEPKANTGGIEVAFVASAQAYDGRFANNAWMQEIAEPITKLVWGNAALMSPATARKNNLKDGDVISVAKGSLKVEAAVWQQPGQADDTVVIALGFGRSKCGRVGKDVGFNAGAIRTSGEFWYGGGFSVATTGKTYDHASMQEHGTMEEPELAGIKGHKRPIYREATIEEYKKEPKMIEEMQEVPQLDSIYPEIKYDKGNQWGMAIDLSSCTGCSACVVACQSENNIPVVGKEQVMRGREMHWLRVDRYYVGPEDEPRAVEQPVPCMQCENAPCENVCPVAATTHSPEGLNDMAYNRCVGTRYCANNCPYKVRHFNFLNFHKNEPEIMSMMHNPDVSVRMRGIMEKCTYCVQRIQESRINAKTDNRREIREGEVQTACQQTCPADAIAFGNINDPNSRVSKLKKQERNYALLAEIDTKPRTTYLARLRNPNPELEVPAAPGGEHA